MNFFEITSTDDNELFKLKVKIIFWKLLQDKWIAIRAETLDKLIEIMPLVCSTVIAAESQYFDEIKILKGTNKCMARLYVLGIIYFLNKFISI